MSILEESYHSIEVCVFHVIRYWKVDSSVLRHFGLHQTEFKRSHPHHPHTRQTLDDAFNPYREDNTREYDILVAPR